MPLERFGKTAARSDKSNHCDVWPLLGIDIGAVTRAATCWKPALCMGHMIETLTSVPLMTVVDE